MFTIKGQRCAAVNHSGHAGREPVTYCGAHQPPVDLHPVTLCDRWVEKHYLISLIIKVIAAQLYREIWEENTLCNMLHSCYLVNLR